MAIFSSISTLVRRRIFTRMMSCNAQGASPLLMLRPLRESGNLVYQFYSLEDKKCLKLKEVGEMECPKIIGSSYGWLASLELSFGSIYLSNPFQCRQIELPPLNLLPDAFNFVWRLMVSGSPDEGDCRALMIYGKDRLLAFCMPRLGNTTWFPISHQGLDHEAVIDGTKRRCIYKKYENLAYCSRRNTFFCIARVHYINDNSGMQYCTSEIESWDLSDPAYPRVKTILEPDFQSHCFDSGCYPWPATSDEDSIVKRFECLKFKYLVVDEASGQLFLVVRHVIPRMQPDGSFRRSILYSDYRGWDHSFAHKTIDFDVFKIDVERKVVSHIESLDGVALFVGLNHPFVVRPMPTSPLMTDSIYFTDLPEHISWHYSGHDNGVFHYVNKTFSRCYPRWPVDLQSMKNPKRRSLQEIISSPIPFWYTRA